MNRRKFMFAGLGAGALLAGTAAWMRPADRGGPYDDYFRALNRELKATARCARCCSSTSIAWTTTSMW